MNKKRKYAYTAMTYLKLEVIATNKKRRYAYTAMTSALLMIVAIIILNLVISVASAKLPLKLDLTRDNILSFSDTTKDVIKNLDTKVNIISLIPQTDNSREMLQIDEVLKKYDTSSGKIKYTRVDTKRNPAVLNKYKLDGKALASDYYVIFETERMYSVVSVNDLLMMYKDKDTQSILAGALSAEQYFSSAIVKVTKGSNITAYVSTGHGECFTSDNFKNNILPGSGYEFKDISLSNEDIPQKADMLILASPETDYSAEEIEKIDAYLKTGGDIAIIGDTVTGDLTNLFAYMEEWGVSFDYGMAADDDQSNYAGYKTYILGQAEDNEIVNTMGVSSQQIVFPLARPVVIKDAIGVAATPLVTTGENGYIKQNVYSSVDSFEEGDIRKKSKLAVMLTTQKSIDNSSHMFVIGTSLFMGDYSSETSQFYTLLDESGNRKFCSGVFAYMTDQPSSFYIMPKNIVQDKVIIDQLSIYIYTMITVVVIPVVILAWGLITWLRRRHS